MKLLPQVCAVIGAVLLVVAIVLKLQFGVSANPRGALEFAQTALLLGILAALVEGSRK